MTNEVKQIQWRHDETGNSSLTLALKYIFSETGQFKITDN